MVILLLLFPFPLSVLGILRPVMEIIKQSFHCVKGLPKLLFPYSFISFISVIDAVEFLFFFMRSQLF
jgi:hypothetical protein